MGQNYFLSENRPQNSFYSSFCPLCPLSPQANKLQKAAHAKRTAAQGCAHWHRGCGCVPEQTPYLRQEGRMVPQTAPSALEPANPPSAWTRMSAMAPNPRSPGHAMVGWALHWFPPTMSRGRNPFGHHCVCALLAMLRGTCRSACYVSCKLMLCACSAARCHLLRRRA